MRLLRPFTLAARPAIARRKRPILWHSIVIRRTMDTEAIFILIDVEPALHQAALDLQYQLTDDGFAKYYPADTPHLDRVFRNLEQYAETMLLQKAGFRPVPWEKALLAFLQVVEGENLMWWLRGSAALAVRGLDIAPGDIDVTTDDAGAHRLGALLLDYLVEPIIPVHNWFCNWWGRAYWDVRIEWMGGVNETADRPEVGDFGPEAERFSETIIWHGYEIRVPPLNLQLAVSERRGLTERAALIRQAMTSANRPHLLAET